MNTTNAIIPAAATPAATTPAAVTEEKPKGFFDMLGSLFSPASSAQTGGKSRKMRKGRRKATRKTTRKATSRRRSK